MKLTKPARRGIEDYPDPMRGKDLAQAYGITSSRVSQLVGTGALPAPKSPSERARPDWDKSTVFRWLAEIRRDENPHCTTRIPLLLPRGGVTWTHKRARTLTVVRDEKRFGSALHSPISVHVATYEADTVITGAAATIHVLTVLEPHGPYVLESLLTPGDDQVSESVIEHLILMLHGERTWSDLVDRRLGRTPDRIAVVVLPTTALSRPDSSSALYDRLGARFAEFEISDEGPPRRFSVSSHPRVTAGDVARVLGHPLPLWPAGHAVPSLVSAWTAEQNADTPLEVDVPPFGQEAYRALRWTQRSAARFGSDEAHVLELGKTMWNTTIGAAWRMDLPEWLQTEQAQAHPAWVPAVTWVPVMQTTHEPGDFMEGVGVVLADPEAPRHIMTAIENYYGDPNQFRTVLLQRDNLDPVLRTALDSSTEPEPLSRRSSWRLWSLYEALHEYEIEDHNLTGARWRARPDQRVYEREPDMLVGTSSDGTRWLAFRPPRDLPRDLASGEMLRRRAVELWIVHDDTGRGTAYLLATDDGTIVPLPVHPHAEPERAAWWLAQLTLGNEPVYGPGGTFGPSHPLADCLTQAMDKGTATVAWRHVVDLASAPE